MALVRASDDRPSASPAGALASVHEASEPNGVDALSDVLRAVRLTGSLFFLVDATTPWVAEAPSGRTLAPAILPGAQQIISYHVITHGVAWCVMAGQPAARLLTEGGAKVSAVAPRVGYDSEAAFSRAFKRATGVPPAAWRRRS